MDMRSRCRKCLQTITRSVVYPTRWVGMEHPGFGCPEGFGECEPMSKAEAEEAGIRIGVRYAPSPLRPTNP